MSADADRRPSAFDRRRPVVFCDFDGTITERDNIVAVMRHLAAGRMGNGRA